MDTPEPLQAATADSASPAGPGSIGLHRRLWVALLFATAISVAYVLLQAPFVRIERFIMEKDQMNLLYMSLIGRPDGFSIGATPMKTVAVLEYFYALFFLFSTQLTTLLWVFLGLKLGAILGLYALLRRHLAPWTAEILALLFISDAHRHWDYWVAFLPNSHAEPFAIALLLLLALFHWRGRFAAFVGANVLVCLMVNLHFINSILVIVPVIVGWKNRSRFDRRKLFLSFVPYLVLGLLFLPQIGRVASLLDPIPGRESVGTPLQAIWISAATLFADQSFLGLLGLFGLGFGLRRALRARPGSSLLDGLIVASMASLLSLSIAYALVGDILIGEASYRCRAFSPAMIVGHFLVLDEVVSWARRPALRTLGVAGALALVSLHAFRQPLDTKEWTNPRPWTWALTSHDVYSMADGARLGRALVAECDASVEALEQTLHLLPLSHEMRFFIETARRERETGEPQPESKTHQVVELLSFDLDHRLHPVEPCLEALEAGATWKVSPECAAHASGGHYLYLLVPRAAVDETRAKLGTETIPLLLAPEIRYQLWDGDKVLRSREPVLFTSPAGTPLILNLPEGLEVREFFESPVLLRDELPPPRTG